MAENGMQKNKEEKMNPQVKVSLNILPFGCIRLQISGAENPVLKSKKEKPRYVEPLITNVEKVDIHFFEDGETYSAPKTTAG